jgi:hypothetical protein
MLWPFIISQFPADKPLAAREGQLLSALFITKKHYKSQHEQIRHQCQNAISIFKIMPGNAITFFARVTRAKKV